MELQLLMLLKRKAMAKIHRSSVTSQMSRYFDTSPQQLKDKPKKSTHKIMFKRHYRIHTPLRKQSRCLLQPPRVMFSVVFVLKKKEENYFIAGSYFSAETDVPLLGRSTEHRPSKGLNEHHSLLNKKFQKSSTKYVS